MSAWTIAVLCGLLLLTSGCATIFTRSTDPISFSSRPEGAQVQIDGMNVGRTPVTIPVKRSLSTPQVRLSLDGYESQFVMLSNTFNEVAILNVFFWPGFIVDAATGSLMKYSIRHYDLELEPRRY